MRELHRLASILLTVLTALCSVLLIKQLGIFHLLTQLADLLYGLLIAVCFVLIFEPVIEKIPLKQRGLRCVLVYLVLFVLIIVIGALFVPVIYSQWEKVMELFHMVIQLAQGESEMAFSYESALNSTLHFLRSFADFALSYLFAFFISLEFVDMKQHLSRIPLLTSFFEFYDEFKEVVFQYVKALVIDLSVLFLAQTFVLTLFHVKYAVSLAFGLSVLNIIPYFGSIVGQILIFLVDYLTMGKFRLGMIFCVFVIQQIESNCLQPVLYGKMMNLRPVTMFASILFFGGMMGITGVLFAPIFAVAIQFFLQKRKHAEHEM